MLKIRIIPKLLLKDGRNVKGLRFERLRDVGHPVSNARIYDAQGADELLFLDISATLEHRATLREIVARSADELFMPLCVGGGIRSVDEIRSLLLAGADKVAVNTAVVEVPEVVTRASLAFGSQCVVASIDFRWIDDEPRVATHGGTRQTAIGVIDHARRAVDLGAGEILLTSIDRDGTMEGYDLDVTRLVADAVAVPVIASGGAGSLEHLAEGVREAHASAVAVGSLFHFTDQSPIKARAYLRGAGLPVRVDA